MPALCLALSSLPPLCCAFPPLCASAPLCPPSHPFAPPPRQPEKTIYIDNSRATFGNDKVFQRALTRAGAVGRMAAAEMSAFYDFSANTIEGATTSMSDYKGKPVLILNVASL